MDRKCESYIYALTHVNASVYLELVWFSFMKELNSEESRYRQGSDVRNRHIQQETVLPEAKGRLSGTGLTLSLLVKLLPSIYGREILGMLQ